MPHAAGQDLTITIPVVDESAAGSPIRTTGTAVFSEAIENGKAACSYNCEIESRNVSQQPVVLLVMGETFAVPTALVANASSRASIFSIGNPSAPGKPSRPQAATARLRE
jgi:hypothetical protein